MPKLKANYPEMQARFQQKQLQEKEQKLLQLYDQQQQRAYQVVQRGSAGSNSSNHGGSTATRTTATTTTHTTSTSQGGKVRQMFDERRQTTVKGIDRSYPLEPLENKSRKQTNSLATQRNGNSMVNRQSVNVKRITRADVNSNVNGGKPVVSYHEEIMRESFGPSVIGRRHDDEDEFVENRVATFANGYRHEADNEQEEVIDRETVENNRMMAKIHLMGFDESLKHHVRNDLENEEFPDDLMVDVPDRLPRRNVTKKLSQAEARLERFKNANAKRSNMSKQLTSTSNVIKKRSEQTTKSNSRITKSPSPDSATRKHHETNARATRGSVPSSPSKSPDIASKYASIEPKNQEAKPLRKSAVTKGVDSTGSKAATIEVVDTIDGVALQNGSLHESTTKKSDAFIIDDQFAKEGDIVSKKSPIKKSSSNKQQRASSASDRPISVSSNSSVSLTHGQVSGTKNKMTTRAKTPASGGPQAKGSFSPRSSETSADNLVACKTCERTFAKDRIGYHEKICVKVVNMKRKKFDAMTFRIKGTELEPFAKKGLTKKQETKKPQVKSDWRRKHEDFINTIRSAKQLQAHMAAGGNLKDFPPPPPSDTSDYIQCPHCNRKFNQAAAERHIPKCETMLHNKPAHLRASRPRR